MHVPRFTRSLAAATALILVLAACSSGDDSAEPTIPGSEDLAGTSTTVAETTSTTPAAASLEETALRFTACMREEGIDIPDISIGADGRPILGDLAGEIDTSSDAFQAALTACSPILTESGALDLSADPELQAAVQDQLQQFSECMRTEGVDGFPDPTPGFTGLGSPFPLAEIPLNDPGFQTALEACQSELTFQAFGD